MYYVYILECSDGTLYTGITTDVERRFMEHKSGKGAAYTKSKGVKKIVYTKKYKNRSMASVNEARIKRMTRREKIKLLAV